MSQTWVTGLAGKDISGKDMSNYDLTDINLEKAYAEDARSAAPWWHGLT